MWRWALLIILPTAGLWGQTAAELFEKAPPDVDEALRSRISLFFQAHVDGKFRLADQVVAEDSKDIFFAAEKPRYRGFEIVRIVYSDKFTRARAVVTVDTDFIAPGFGRMPVKIPVASLWKLEGGQWWWYVDPEASRQTPFGTMKAGPPGQAHSPFPVSIPTRPEQAAAMLAKVAVDKTEVRLSSYQPAADEILVSSQVPGVVALKLEYSAFPGFEARLERSELKPNETTRLLLRMEPRDKAPKPTLTLTLRVEPTNQQIPIRVTFAVPPELEKTLPQ